MKIVRVCIAPGVESLSIISGPICEYGEIKRLYGITEIRFHKKVDILAVSSFVSMPR